VTAADRVIRWTTAGAVVGVAAVAAVASYEHAYALARAHGEAGGDGPAGTADGGRADLRQLDGDARLGPEEGAGFHRWRDGCWAWGLPRRSRPTLRTALAMGRLVRLWLRWPVIALVGSYELLMVIIRSDQLPTGAAAGPETSGAPGDGPLQVQAAEEFAGEVATGRVPSVRMIRARLHIGQPRAQRVRAYLAALSNP
jgi:hypothetical protein